MLEWKKRYGGEYTADPPYDVVYDGFTKKYIVFKHLVELGEFDSLKAAKHFAEIHHTVGA